MLARVDTCGWVTLTGDGAGRFSGTLPPCAQPGSAVVEIQATAGGAAHSDLLNVTVTP